MSDERLARIETILEHINEKLEKVYPDVLVRLDRLEQAEQRRCNYLKVLYAAVIGVVIKQLAPYLKNFL